MAMTPREQLASATMIATHEIVVNLEKAKASLEGLFDEIHDPICLITPQGRILWGNKSIASLLNTQKDLVHLQILSQLFSEQDWQRALQVFLNLRTHSEPDDTLEFQMPIRQAASIREILWNVQPFHAVSTRRGAVLLLVGRDITEALQDRTERTKLEAELATAEIMQRAFFPAAHLQSRFLELASYYRPAEKCSGDWWGHFQFEEGVELVCVADVTGHGAASALVTAMTHATCLAYVNQCRATLSEERLHPNILLSQINKIVYETFRGEIFVTFFAILFNANEAYARIANAGHHFPLYIPGMYRDINYAETNTSSDRKPLRTAEALVIQGNPIGFDPLSAYDEKYVTLHNGDRYIMFTDGIIECSNSLGKPYGASKFRKSIANNRALPILEFRDKIVNSAVEHFAGKPIDDDVTLVVIDLNLRPATSKQN